MNDRSPETDVLPHATDTVDPTAVRRSRLRSAPRQAKRLLQFFFLVAALPRVAFYRVAKAILGSRALTSSSESIARVPGLRGVYLRQAFYRMVLSHCAPDVYLGWCSVFSMSEASVGQNAYIGRFCSIGFAEIGDEAMLADGVQILSGGREHNHDDASQPIQNQGQTYTRVRIGRGAWIGAGAIVMADVGEHAIVGAGAVVNRPVPARCIAVGVPARVVKRRDEVTYGDSSSPVGNR